MYTGAPPAPSSWARCLALSSSDSGLVSLPIVRRIDNDPSIKMGRSEATGLVDKVYGLHVNKQTSDQINNRDIKRARYRIRRSSDCESGTDGTRKAGNHVTSWGRVWRRICSQISRAAPKGHRNAPNQLPKDIGKPYRVQ